MNPTDLDWKAVGSAALGGLIVLTFVCFVALWAVRELWLWAKTHLSTFESISAQAKGGKVMLGATIEDVRTRAPVHEDQKSEGQNGLERHNPASLS